MKESGNNMNSILNGLPKVYSETGDITDYLQHIYDAANDIEQIAKSLKVLPQIEPYADNICNSLIIIRANINCIQDIPLKKKEGAEPDYYIENPEYYGEDGK